MPDIIRSKSVQLYSKKLPERARTFVQRIPVSSAFEQALVSARSEIEQALRRFAKRIQTNDQEAA